MMLNRILIVVFTIAALMGQAQAAVTFALRGNSLTPRYAAGGKASANYLSNVYAASPAAVANFGHASVFGGQAIDLIGLSDTRSLLFNSYGNWVTGSNVFSALFRIIPNWTGNPAGVRRVVKIGQASSPAFAGGLLLEIQTDGKMFAVARDASDKGTLLFSFTTASALSFTSGTATDIMIVSDGTRVYMSQDGVEIHDAALASTTAQLGALVAGAIWLGPYPWDGSYNEVVIWNTAEPHEYAARTDFISVADFDGTSSADPGEANVRSLTAYTIAGVAKTGTAAIPGASSVKIGVATDATTGTYDGSDRWTCPVAGDLRLSSTLKCNSTTTNLTGTLASPALSAVKIGVAGDGGFGTYDGSDRWTCPLAGQLTTGVQLKCNSTILNLTGTRDTVTNILSTKTMSGSSTSGTLIAR